MYPMNHNTMYTNLFEYRENSIVFLRRVLPHQQGHVYVGFVLEPRPQSYPIALLVWISWSPRCTNTFHAAGYSWMLLCVHFLCSWVTQYALHEWLTILHLVGVAGTSLGMRSV